MAEGEEVVEAAEVGFRASARGVVGGWMRLVLRMKRIVWIWIPGCQGRQALR
jgi:hypothetical protein